VNRGSDRDPTATRASGRERAWTQLRGRSLGADGEAAYDAELVDDEDVLEAEQVRPMAATLASVVADGEAA